MARLDAHGASLIEALRSDHRRATRLLGLLVERIENILRLQADDLRIVHDIIRYMVDFVDRLHHAREDSVIERLTERQPQFRAHVGEFARVHGELGREGDTLLRELAAMLERRRGVPAKAIAPRLANYAASLASHFIAEEHELFERAANLLTAEDWQEVAGIGHPGEDPLFGSHVERGYEALFEAYVGQVRAIGTPSRATAPKVVAVLFDSAAALLGGARGTASAILSGSAGAMRANFAGASALAQSRSRDALGAAASTWRSQAGGSVSAAARRVRDLSFETTYSTFEPVGSAISGPPRQFAAMRRHDRLRPSWQAHLVNLGLRTVIKRAGATATLESIRQPPSKFQRMLTALDDDVIVSRSEVGGGSAETFEIKGMTPERTILNLPGGGFVMQATRAHRLMAARLARHGRARVMLVHYRLAPENPFPAGLDDCVAAYRSLLAGGTDPASIVLCGDSAGGGLVFSTLLRLRDERLPLPAAAVAMSPVTDLGYSGASRTDNRWHDPMLRNDESNIMAQIYLGEVPADDPFASPLYADLSGLPPVLVQVGSVEVLLDDSLRIAAKIRAQGGECECEVWQEMPHDWMLFGMLPEAKKALAHIVEFVARHTTPTPVKARVRLAMEMDDDPALAPHAIGRRTLVRPVFLGGPLRVA
ncbi:MAG: alpha/beta hydrolase fold domain-containing protein [Novosphingobium sp.]